MYLIRSGAIEGFEQLVRKLGGNPIALISEAGLAQSQFRHPDTYVSYRKIAELLELAAEHCNEQGFTMLLRQPAPAATDKPIHVGDFSRIHFGAKVNGIQFPRQWLNRSLQQDEKVFQQHFQQNLQALQRRYPNKLTHEVRNIMGSLLPTGDCRLERVAATLGLHPRVLQKRLKTQGTSYNQLLQETRMVIAQQHLRIHSTSITDLAFSLGYSDISVFSRHFKSWTGMSPRNWRRGDL